MEGASERTGQGKGLLQAKELAVGGAATVEDVIVTETVELMGIGGHFWTEFWERVAVVGNEV